LYCRSDIGPAREASQEDADGNPDAAAAAAAAAAATAGPAAKKPEKEDDERFLDNENEEGLLGTGPYDEEDEEADRIYAQIDAKMDERRRVRREAREKEELIKYRQMRPKIQQQFSDIKRSLSGISEDEWMSIPEAGDMRTAGRKLRRQKEKERERFTPAPDSLIAAARSQNETVSHLDDKQQVFSGLVTPASSGLSTPSAGLNTPLADFRQISKARDDLLKVKLDQITDSVGGSSTIDPKGYLTDLNSVILKSEAEIGDIKKARELLKSVITTNPKHAPGWIAAARVEEIDGKLGQARTLIARGCEECPKNEDVWLEAARLNSLENSKIILANAVRQIPQSTKIWLQAMSLESEVKAKKRILRKALEFVPNSIKLWKAAVEMEEDPEDARILLARAVECVPLSVELWLALARLETYENAMVVINRARAAIPNSHEIWIAGARLKETIGDEKSIEMIINRAVSALSAKGANLSREQWLREAENCEQSGSVLTCQAIIRATIALDIDEEDRKHTWMDDADGCVSRRSIETARAIFAHALKVFPGKKSVWRRAAFLEKEHGTRESLEELLQRAVRHCPQAEMLWLMGAKEKWLSGDVAGARAILTEAFKANTNSEQIWLAAVKLETENGEYERGRLLLHKAKEQAGTERVYVKAIVLERNLENVERAQSILAEALERYPKYAKFWMMKGQMEEKKGDPKSARETYGKAVKLCSKSVVLWTLAARLEESIDNVIRARAILDKARLLNPKSPELWCESVRVELRANNTAVARATLAKALQECPTSGLLWSEAIFMEPRPSRKSKSVDALKKCENDPLIVVAVARLFWSERNVDKARGWFNRAVKLDVDKGDSWAWFYKFEIQHGTPEQQKDVVDRCIAADPHHGEKWPEIAKDPQHWKKPIADILKLTAACLGGSH
jgi:pre-mRNA-processing factor 6